MQRRSAKISPPNHPHLSQTAAGPVDSPVHGSLRQGRNVGSLVALLALVVVMLTIALATSVPAQARTNLVISEIHYHPADSAAKGEVKADDLEFIELFNPSPDPVKLDGYRLSKGVKADLEGTIAAGGYVIVAKDADAAEATYGVKAVGDWKGNLSNGGDTIRLRNTNDDIIDEVTYADAGAWPRAADGKGSSLELVRLRSDNNVGSNWAASADGPTPAARNSATPAPEKPITDVTNTPKRPGPKQPVTISARVPGASEATLIYRVGYGPRRQVAMQANGSVFTATIPAQTAGELVRYRVTDSDASRTAPRQSDTRNFFGYVVKDPAAEKGLPTIQWFMKPGDFETMNREDRLTNKMYPTVVAYGDQVVDNARVRIRGGEFGRLNFAKQSFEIELPEGHTISVPEVVDHPVDQFALQAEWGDWTWGRALATWWVFEQAGFPEVASDVIRVHQGGEFFGLYFFQEKLDADWRKSAGLDGGAFYRANEGGWDFPDRGFEVKEPKGGTLDPMVAMAERLNAHQSDDKANFLFENFDVANIVNYLAVSAVTGHDDQLSHNFYVFHDADHTDRWSLYPWDVGLTFGLNLANCQWDPMVELGCVGDDLFDAFWQVDEFREMYWRRVRTLLDGPLGGQRLENRHAKLLQRMDADIESELAKWQGRSSPRDNQIAFDNGVAARREAFRVEGRVPSSATGRARILINEILADPADGMAEYVELYNPTGAAIDISDYRLDGVDGDLPGGSVIRPFDYLVLTSDIAELTESGALAGKRVVVAEFDGGLKNGGETLTLLDRRDRVIDRVTYSDSSPWPSGVIESGRSLQRLDGSDGPTVDWVGSQAAGGSPGSYNNGDASSASTVAADDRAPDKSKDEGQTPSAPAPTGEAGRPKATCRGLAVTIRGTAGDDVIEGTPGRDVISTGTGDDTINGLAGNDVICAGAGNDRINGGAGRDTILGERGRDNIRGGPGADLILGGSGNDVLRGDGERDKIQGGRGNDRIYGNAGTDRLEGGPGRDTLWGGSANDWISGGDGNDKAFGGDGNDRVRGGPGADRLLGAKGADRLHGADGNDVLIGGLGRGDRCNGGPGRDQDKSCATVL